MLEKKHLSLIEYIDSSPALKFHASFPCGKLGSIATKNIFANPSLGYTPGVAEAVKLIFNNPKAAEYLTNKKLTVPVITNGMAVLGYGKTGPLASKPVMEGKAAFLIYAGLNSFDIEIAQNDPYKLAECIISIATGFGGIILEDIPSPDCFIVEEIVSNALSIPIMHDDQHGTAIVVCAGLLRWLEHVNCNIENIKIVCVGAGAAGISTLDLLVAIGAKKQNIKLFDSKGLVKIDTDNIYKAPYGSEGGTIEEECRNADVLIGLSAANSIPTKCVDLLNKNGLLMVLSNPDPEVDVNSVTRKDLTICTGRSDYDNQINNALCFPSLMRVAVHYGLKIAKELKIAAVKAICEYSRIFGHKIIPSTSNEDLVYILPVLIAEQMNLPNVPDFARAVLSCIFGFKIDPQYTINAGPIKTNFFLKKMNLEHIPCLQCKSVEIENPLFILYKIGDCYILQCNEIIEAIINILHKYYKNMIVISNKPFGAIKICMITKKMDELKVFIAADALFADSIRINLAIGECATYIKDCPGANN